MVSEEVRAHEDDLWAVSVPLAKPPQDEAKGRSEICLPKDGRGSWHRLYLVVGCLVVLEQVEGLVPMAGTSPRLPSLLGRRFWEKGTG